MNDIAEYLIEMFCLPINECTVTFNFCKNILNYIYVIEIMACISRWKNKASLYYKYPNTVA